MPDPTTTFPESWAAAAVSFVMLQLIGDFGLCVPLRGQQSTGISSIYYAKDGRVCVCVCVCVLSLAARPPSPAPTTLGWSVRVCAGA